MTTPGDSSGDSARHDADQPPPAEQARTQIGHGAVPLPPQPTESRPAPPTSGYPPPIYPPPGHQQPSSPPPGTLPTGYASPANPHPAAYGGASANHPWQETPPPPIDPQQPPVNYPESAPGYPPPPPFYPPRYPPGPPGYPGYPGYAGYSDPYDPYPVTPPGTNSLAIGSLVASIGGFPLLFLCYLGVASWVVGVVLGIVALNQIKQTNQEGRGMAIAGIAVGAVALVIAAIAAMVFVVAVSKSSVLT